MCQSIQNFNIRRGNLPGIWTFKDRPGQILIPSSVEAPAGYPIVSPALPFSLSPTSLRYREAFAEEREILLIHYGLM